jgi:cytokinesis protein
VTQIASSLNSPHLPTRKLILDILVFVVYWDEGRAFDLVIEGLKTLSADNHEGGNCYTFWFKSLETILTGRGRMGTLVGASDEVKRHGGVDPSLNDYTVGSLSLRAPSSSILMAMFR